MRLTILAAIAAALLSGAVQAATDSALVAKVQRYYEANQHKAGRNYGANWYRVLIAFGATPTWSGPGAAPTTAFSADDAAKQEEIWAGWRPIRQELERLEREAQQQQQQQQQQQDEVLPPVVMSSDDAVGTSYTSWGSWNAARVGYRTETLWDISPHSDLHYQPSGTKPGFRATWSGPIDGERAPGWESLSKPRIELTITSVGASYDRLVARTTWVHDGHTPDYIADDRRHMYSIYGALVREDGTFNSFPDRTWAGGELHRQNPTGVNGQFYGGAHGAVAGHIVTPQIFGTYAAKIE